MIVKLPYKYYEEKDSNFRQMVRIEKQFKLKIFNTKKDPNIKFFAKNK